MTNLRRASQYDSYFPNESQLGECESFWLVSGPPFDQRDYMISPSDSGCSVESKKPTPETKRKVRPSDIKIDPKYLLDSQKALKKLVDLIRDGSAERFLNRLKALMCKFLRGSPPGFLVEDIPLIVEVVEYFSRNKSSVPEFEEFVKIMMKCAMDPPKIGKNSDVLHCTETIADYFTLFGELLAAFEDEHFQLHLLGALDCLIVRRKLVGLSSITLSLCHEAMEESQLPLVVAALMETVSCTLYIHYLELAQQMILVSLKAGYTMIQSNLLDFVLRRLDPFFGQDSKSLPEQSLYTFENNEQRNSYYRVLDKSGYLIWGLLSLISKCDVQFPCPSETALRSLKYVFLCEARRENQKAADTRNNLGGIIVKLFSVFGGRLPMVQTSLAVEIAKLAIATEINVEDTSSVKLGTSKEDYILKKLMLLGCCLMATDKNLIEILKSQKVVEGVLRLISARLSVPWIPSQYLTLLLIGLRTLSELVPALPEVFVDNKGNTKLLSLMKWLMDEHLDQDVLLEALKTFCAIVSCENNKCIIDDIKAQGGVDFILELCVYLLNADFMKIEDQEKLSRVFVVLEILLKNDKKLQITFAEPCVSVSVKMLERILANSINDSKWNPKLLISFGAFIWEAIAWCQSSLRLFFEKGGTFLLLDLIELSSFPLQMFFLGILVDMTDEGGTITHLITWRGKDGYGILNMMIDIWRKEEYFTKVPRTPNGLIKDVEAPLMTEEQWYLTYQVRDAHIYSPSIAEMVCSARPKIHALYQFLQRRYFALTQMGESSYCLQFKVVRPSYQVYIPLIEHFLALKMGEVWFEVWRDANYSGVIPTSFDGEVLCSLIDEKNKWASRIKTVQEEIQLFKMEGEAEDEKNFYKFLKTCRLSSSLEALRELDYVTRTSFHKFQKEKKQRQIEQVERSLAIFPFLNDIGVHRTFLFKTNVTGFYGNYVWIKSEKEIEEEEELLPVSVESSGDRRFDYLDDF